MFSTEQKKSGTVSRLFFYTETFRKSQAPITVIPTANPAITAALMSGLICEAPVRPYRIPSTPYVSGSIRVTGSSHAGRELMGKSAPDNPKSGKTTKFMIELEAGHVLHP